MVEMIVSHSGRDSSSSHIVAGVVFTHMPPDGATLPRHIRYKIRLQFANDTRTLFPYAKSRQGPREATAWHGGSIRTTQFTRITHHFCITVTFIVLLACVCAMVLSIRPMSAVAGPPSHYNCCHRHLHFIPISANIPVIINITTINIITTATSTTI